MQLIPHPGHAPAPVVTVDAAVWRERGQWRFRFLVDGIGELVIPESASPGRADELWRTTCFEAFVGGEAASYREYNFSPSGQWAAYDFDGPRTGMRDADEAVEVWLEGGEDWIAIEAAVAAELVPGSPINLTAMIEETGGRKSYWALAHPDGPPDFHNRDCFVAHLPPVEAP